MYNDQKRIQKTNQQNKMFVYGLKQCVQIRERSIFFNFFRLFNVSKLDFNYPFPIQRTMFRHSNSEDMIYSLQRKQKFAKIYDEKV